MATASAALLRQLAGQDAVLGPNVPGRDPLEDALAGFAGAPGGPPLHPWEAGLAPRASAGAPPGLLLQVFASDDTLYWDRADSISEFNI